MTRRAFAFPLLLLAVGVTGAGCASSAQVTLVAQQSPAPPPLLRPVTTTGMAWLAPRANGAGFEVGAWQHVLRRPAETEALPPLPGVATPSVAGATAAPSPQLAQALAALRRSCARGPQVLRADDLTLLAWLQATPPGTPVVPDCALLTAADTLREAMAPWR